MTPLHVVMIGVPAHGHMNPHLPVLAELVARGHRVEVTTPSGSAAHQEQWPVPDRPVLLVSLGSAYSAPPTFYRACLDAFATSTGRSS